MHWVSSHVFMIHFYTACMSLLEFEWSKLMNLLLYSILVWYSSSGSSHRGGAAVQAPGQIPPSPANVAHLELPDLGVENVLELQLQQLTLAQFTVATMEHAIPLLKTG